MTRDEFQLRQREFQPRGMDLPQTKLMPLDVSSIRSDAVQRANMRKYINDNLTNDALAKKFGVHVRTIEKVLSYASWSHEP